MNLWKYNGERKKERVKERIHGNKKEKSFFFESINTSVTQR